MTPDQLNRITASVLADLDALVEPLAKGYRRLLRRSGRRMAKAMRAQAVNLTAAILPPDEDEVVPRDLRAQVDKLTERERSDLVRALIAAYEAHEIGFDVAPTLSAELLEKVGAHATFAADEALREVYRGVIERAAAEGLSVPHTAREIVTAVDGVAESRAVALARTDLIGLANGASQSIATEAFAGREDVLKVWLATEDERTRETHVEANGQEVSLNEYFDVGGHPLMYPGDPEGPDEEVINCRCTIIYSGGSGGEEEAEVASAFVESITEHMTRAVENPGVASATTVFTVPEEFLDLIDYAPVRSESYAAAMDKNGVTAAVTITVDDEAAAQEAAERQRVPWEGILAIAGSPTSDRRYLIPGEVGQRELPLPLAASHDDQHETETVGRIEDIQHIPLADFDREGWELPADLPERAVVIWGEGTFDGSEASDEALRQLENGVGVSLDLPIERQALIDAATFEEVDPMTLPEEDLLGIAFGMVPEGYLRGIGGKIGGLSLASIAAFEETKIRIVEDALVASASHAVVTSGFIRAIPRDPIEVLVASGAPLAPPREWFFVEEANEPTPLTILPNGQFYGHLALWNTCHAGRANGAYSSCMYAPHSRSGYSQFHLGAILCEDGSEVPIGRFTIGTGHAPLHLNAAAARAHYDNTGTCVGFGRAKDGVFGIWICGVLKSDATAEQIRDFRACPPSGDWRSHDHALELQAALAVNTAGFPVPRSQLSLSASADVLEVSALILGPPHAEDFDEALRAEYGLLDAEGPDMLVDIGSARFELTLAE